MNATLNAGDAANLIFKAQLTNQTQAPRAPQAIKESNRARESERAGETDEAESLDEGAHEEPAVGLTRREGQPRIGRRQDQVGLGFGRRDHAGEGSVEHEWLPPSLQPQARTAGTSNPWNIPYWLARRDDKPSSESPLVAHRRLLNGLKNKVNIDLQQYIKSNEPTYTRKTLRDLYTIFSDNPAGVSVPQGRGQAVTGDPSGLNVVNWRRAHATYNLLEFPQPELGEAFEEVA